MAGWTQTDIDTLKAAIASGVLSVSYSGPPARSVTYQSTEAMLQALAVMQQEVSATAGNGTRYRLGATRKGLGW